MSVVHTRLMTVHSRYRLRAAASTTSLSADTGATNDCIGSSARYRPHRYRKSFTALQLDVFCCTFIGPILWGHSGPLCHALSLLWTSILHCHSPGVATVARRLRYSWLRLILVVVSTVATPGEWQCKIRTGSVRRPAVANGPNIFQILLVFTIATSVTFPRVHRQLRN